MRTRTEPAWATDHRISPSCGTWHSTSCRRMARRRRCAASFSGPDGTTPISPASWLYSEVQLPCLVVGYDRCCGFVLTLLTDHRMACCVWCPTVFTLRLTGSSAWRSLAPGSQLDFPPAIT